MMSIAEALAGMDTSSSSMGKLLSERLKALKEMTAEEKHEYMRELEQRQVDSYNAMPGNLCGGYTNSDNNQVAGDGYNCPLCLNRGDIAVLTERNGVFYRQFAQCKCMSIRRSIWRMKASGLEKSIKDYTFKTFIVREPWQQRMLDTANGYLAEGVKEGKWLYFGGQVGCGKTHICTAVAGKLLYERPLLYVVWPQVSKTLKAIVNDAEEYSKQVTKLETIEVLYIDDLFKPVKDDFGKMLPPTPADMRLAFEILNYRYINKLPTILSSEWGISECTDMDEATGSRIAERSRGFNMMVGRDRSRNQRLIDMVSV